MQSKVPKGHNSVRNKHIHNFNINSFIKNCLHVFIKEEIPIVVKFLKSCI